MGPYEPITPLYITSIPIISLFLFGVGLFLSLFFKHSNLIKISTTIFILLVILGFFWIGYFFLFLLPFLFFALISFIVGVIVEILLKNSLKKK